METDLLIGEHSSTPEPGPDVRLQQIIILSCIFHVACQVRKSGLIQSHSWGSVLWLDVLCNHEFFLVFFLLIIIVSMSLLASSSQPFVSFENYSHWFPYLSTLVSASRLFIMPRAPTPPENPFWWELELGWRGCPMAISDSCFCIMARFTCGGEWHKEINKWGNICCLCLEGASVKT